MFVVSFIWFWSFWLPTVSCLGACSHRGSDCPCVRHRGALHQADGYQYPSPQGCDRLIPSSVCGSVGGGTQICERTLPCSLEFPICWSLYRFRRNGGFCGAQQNRGTLVSLVIYRILYRRGGADQQQKERLERTAGTCVGLAMCLSGAAMALIALLAKGATVGNVLPALIIASLGGLTNLWFWLRYRKLHRQTADVILASQGKLYGAKTLVDACVTLALELCFSPPPARRCGHDWLCSRCCIPCGQRGVTIRSVSGGAAGT